MGKNDWLVKKVHELDDEAFAEVAGEIAEKEASVVTRAPKDDVIHITEIEDQIKEEHDNWGKVRGLRSGFISLDKKIGGMDKGHVILIGGETSNGKSALAANIAVQVSKSNPVLFITLEMRTAEIGSRIMHINNGSIDGLNLMFQAEHRLTYKDLKPLISKAIEYNTVEDDPNSGLKMVVLDYLQYLGRGMKPEEVAVMSKEIKTLALEFNIPFIVIVSLRKGEGGKQKRKWTEIEIEDFMGTGSIGYDADTAMIASRKDKDNDFDEDGLWVKVLKTRNAKLDWNDRYIRFKWEATRIEDDPFYSDDGFTEAN